MGKGIFWVVVVALGVFVGLFAFEQFKGYQERVAGQRALGEQEAILEQKAARQQAIKEQRAAERKRRRTENPDQKINCAMDADTENCVCMDKETGNTIPMNPYECVLRASKSS